MIFHRHKYEIRAVRPIRLWDRYAPERTAGHITQILYVCCRCGNIKEKEIDGSWTADLLEKRK